MMDRGSSATVSPKVKGVQISSHEWNNILSSSESVLDNENTSDSYGCPTKCPTYCYAGPQTNNPSHGSQEQAQLIARRDWFAYIKTWHFWMVLSLGQLLAIGITGTGTMSTLLANAGVSLPAFQMFPNYVLLNLMYTPVTIYQYGLKKYGKFLMKHGWRYAILSFLDVEGNFFMILAYRDTTILSVQLISFWSIVVVVLSSYTFLRVRYRLAQYAGILICLGGMGILIATDHVTGSNSSGGKDPVKGDLFALLGASCYGVSNVFEEFLLSKRPLYEVIGQLGLWGTIVSGAQTGIFHGVVWHGTKWTSPVGLYFSGFTLILFAFYNLVPMLLRLASAAFLNISVLTANFWAVLIGVELFGYSVHWMYPIAFALVVFGLLVYFLTDSILGDTQKPWLGDDQEDGIEGIGTARRAILRHSKMTNVASPERIPIIPK